jgi:hypothetical protein
MPDVQQRDKREKELAALIAGILLLSRERFEAALLGSRSLDSALAQQLHDELLYGMAAPFWEVRLRAIEQMNRELGQPIDMESAQQLALQDGTLQARRLADLVTLNTLRQIEQAATRAQQQAAQAIQLPPEQQRRSWKTYVLPLLGIVFGIDRAMRIAVTEITRANTGGERIAAELLYRISGGAGSRESNIGAGNREEPPEPTETGQAANARSYLAYRTRRPRMPILSSGRRQTRIPLA